MEDPNQNDLHQYHSRQSIQWYFHLAMPQFMTADVVLVLHQLFSQQLSYETGIMTCRNQNPWEDCGKVLSRLTTIDFEASSTNTEAPLSSNVEHVVKTITTKCKSLAHTAEAAQEARKHQFTMMDHLVWVACFSQSHQMMNVVFVSDCMLIPIMRYAIEHFVMTNLSSFSSEQYFAACTSKCW